MKDLKSYKRVLSKKSASINVFYYAIRDTEDKSWRINQDGSKTRDGTQVPLEKLMAYSEGFLFEIGAFLDIFIKYICGKDTSEHIYFNLDTLNKITNPDKFIESLKNYWNSGISNNSDMGLKKMKEYRNAITHAVVLDTSKHLMWSMGDGFPTLSKNYYILADNPSEEFGDYTYNKKISLFGFIEEIDKIFDSIISKIKEEELFNKYLLKNERRSKMNETEKLILKNQLFIMNFLRRIKETCSDSEQIADEEFTEDYDKIKLIEDEIKELIDKDK